MTVTVVSISREGLPAYVLHGGRDPDRRAALEPDLSHHGIQATWLVDVNVADLSPELVGRYYRGRRWLWWRRSSATRRTRFRPLLPQDIATAISHIETYERIVEAGAAWTLILEDDALLAPEFGRLFDEYFERVPEDADLIFIGSCCGLRIEHVEPGLHFYRKDHPATKCGDSYLITARAAEIVLRTIVPFVLPIDWELNYHLKRHDLVVYWLEPPLVRQGSEIGAYESSNPARRSDGQSRGRRSQRTNG